MQPEHAAALGTFTLTIIVIFWALNALIGWLIAKGKGRGTAGFWWGFFLGPIGWIIAATLEPSDAVRKARAIEDAALVQRVVAGDKVNP